MFDYFIWDGAGKTNVVCVPKGQYHFPPLLFPCLDGKGFSLR